MAGLASGIAYNTVMSTVTAHFQDKPGLISGILLMGFGIGSFIIGKVYQKVISSGYIWQNVFVVFGILLSIVMIICAICMKKNENISQSKNENISQSKDENIDEKIQVTTKQMLGKKSFWLFFVWAVILSACGLAIISQAGAIIIEISPSITDVSTMVGIISIFNGVGRVLFGGMFDKIGRVCTMLLNEILFFVAIALIILSINTGNISILIISFIFTGLAYGGVPTTNSAFINLFYGRKHYAVNFSLLNMNILLASFGGTIAGKVYDVSGSYLYLMYAMIAFVIISMIIATRVKED